MTTGPNPCWLCNADIRSSPFEIEVIEGGRRPRSTTDPPADENHPGYMGWFPVGADCARKLRKQGINVVRRHSKKED